MTPTLTMTVSQAPVQIRLLSDPRFLAVVRPAVEVAAQRFGLSVEQAAEVVLAVDEALANIMRHGYQGRTDGVILLKLAPLAADDRTAGMRVTLLDRCPRADLDEIRARTLRCGEPEALRPGGLGLRIMHEVMDQVIFRSRADGPGLSLEMVKTAAPHRPS